MHELAATTHAGAGPFHGRAGQFVLPQRAANKCALNAIIETYPTVARIVGDEVLEVVANDYFQACPPARAQIEEDGSRFPEFIGGHSISMALPYLRGVARIDRLCTEARLSKRAPAFGPQDLARMSADEWARSKVVFHPATRFAWFPNPAPSIWLAHSLGVAGTITPAWHAEGILITRGEDAVGGIVIGPSAHRIIHGLRLGETVSQAAIAAARLYPEASISTDFHRIVASGALSKLKPKR
ncbi:HvfC/BufC family peptide modification chaperone [Erythrobacter mangrovi]|uniref:Putative DNA-binding domain-containing protein n=1 Tax=Erythrobacter mangrovi TaxID=2739433 RepID=A0A7D3XXP3_9SPHN|nr:putative DNA-binding domain-containing protein [Erythrobacter mangrovi]QKG72576.1 putative DNA-binding domain-containing protein [Erythrobacter mangrovi]